MSRKYVIEIEEAPYENSQPDSTKLYKAVGFNSLVFDQNGLDKLTPYNDGSGYAAGFATAERKYRGICDNEYQRGLDAAWGAARKLALDPNHGGYSFEELDACFGKEWKNYYKLFRDYPVGDIVKKIREYEEQKLQFRVGDEIQQVTNSGDPTGEYCIITNIGNDKFTGINRRGKSVLCSSQITRWWRKTGRHVDLSELFRGEDE